MRRLFLPLLAVCLTASCTRYAEFTLPPAAAAGSAFARAQWLEQPAPQLEPGAPGQWDSSDVLNPSVVRHQNLYWNYYSGFDGTTWHTGLADSADGIHWSKRGRVLSPQPAGWEGNYIAANGTALVSAGETLYWYQAGPRGATEIGLARSRDGRTFTRQPQPVLRRGPYLSWDEAALGDPYVIAAGDSLWMFYLGQDRARRQRLGLARSTDGVHWTKLRSNPILDLGAAEAFDEVGLGEPAVWASGGAWWMLYTGRDRREQRRLGLARSADGVHWTRLPDVFSGAQPWDATVVCDPTVEVAGNEVRVWFGGGDRPSPDENLHGRIGFAVLKPR